jgi:hypothetical protein
MVAPGRLSHQLDVGVGFDDRAKPVTVHRMVLCHHDP